MNLASLAQLAAKDEPKAEGPSPSPSLDAKPSITDDVLERAMDEFRSASDSKSALRSLRALLAHLK